MKLTNEPYKKQKLCYICKKKSEAVIKITVITQEIIGTLHIISVTKDIKHPNKIL